eukprot:325112-Alexandrium_andersonii.AAC.1
MGGVRERSSRGPQTNETDAHAVVTRAVHGRPSQPLQRAVRLWVMCDSAHHAGLRRTRPMHTMSSIR